MALTEIDMSKHLPRTLDVAGVLYIRIDSINPGIRDKISCCANGRWVTCWTLEGGYYMNCDQCGGRKPDEN